MKTRVSCGIQTCKPSFLYDYYEANDKPPEKRVYDLFELCNAAAPSILLLSKPGKAHSKAESNDAISVELYRGSSSA